jgi:hypothetical protein
VHAFVCKAICFSHSKIKFLQSVIAEISSWQEIPTLLEYVNAFLFATIILIHCYYYMNYLYPVSSLIFIVNLNIFRSVCFTQQLILFAPQAVSVHIHVKNLLMTLASRQPIIRRLSVSTLRHLVEKDPVNRML